MNRTIILIFICFTICLTLFVKSINSCSCMPQHPQEAACKSDYVIVAKIVKIFIPKVKNDVYYHDDNNFKPPPNIRYKIRIKRAFKLSKKARLIFKSNTIFAPSELNSCSIQLKKNETYLITGRIMNLKAQISLCNYIRPWSQITHRQRKGFKVLYKHGCSNCKIQTCFYNCDKHLPNETTCVWDMTNECTENFGICLTRRHHCVWMPNLKQQSCENSRKFQNENDEP